MRRSPGKSAAARGPSRRLQRIARTEAVRIEEELAAALRAAGLFVQGGH